MLLATGGCVTSNVGGVTIVKKDVALDRPFFYLMFNVYVVMTNLYS